MNMEQLNNCLITLKQMYRDLRKQNRVCRNEGEFQAYFILILMEDKVAVAGNCSQMAPEVYSSPQVQVSNPSRCGDVDNGDTINYNGDRDSCRDDG